MPLGLADKGMARQDAALKRRRFDESSTRIGEVF